MSSHNTVFLQPIDPDRTIYLKPFRVATWSNADAIKQLMKKPHEATFQLRPFRSRLSSRTEIQIIATVKRLWWYRDIIVGYIPNGQVSMINDLIRDTDFDIRMIPWSIVLDEGSDTYTFMISIDGKANQHDAFSTLWGTDW